MSVERPSYVRDVRHQPQLLTIEIREYISKQQQLGQIVINALFISTLGLHSQACQSVHGLGNYWFHDTKLVDGFLSDGPHASSIYRSTHPLTHHVCTTVKHSTQQKNPSTNSYPRTYHVCTTVQQLQHSRKKRSKKAGTGDLN